MEFKRYDGLVGSIPQSFIDEKLIKCPMCGSGEPDWHCATKMGFLENRNLFQCQQCKAIISSSVAELAGFNKTIITTPGLLKKLSGKKLNEYYFKVEEVGSMQTTELNKGKEFTLNELVEMSESY